MHGGKRRACVAQTNQKENNESSAHVFGKRAPRARDASRSILNWDETASVISFSQPQTQPVWVKRAYVASTTGTGKASGMSQTKLVGHTGPPHVYFGVQRQRQ